MVIYDVVRCCFLYEMYGGCLLCAIHINSKLSAIAFHDVAIFADTEQYEVFYNHASGIVVAFETIPRIYLVVFPARKTKY